MISTKLLRAFEPAKLCFSTSSNSYVAVKLDIEECCSPVARTAIKNPAEHSKNHHGMWYTIDETKGKELFRYGLTTRYKELNEIFRETSLMIREPSTTIIDYIKRSDLEKPPNKFMLYGDEGVGKTLCLAHVLHYLSLEGWMIIHTHLPKLWVNQFTEIKPSIKREGFYDHTIDGAAWLKHFKSQNESLLKELGLVTSERFEWTQREATEAGSPLLDFIDDGINRPRYASECVHFLIRHLKQSSTDGRCKVAFLSDGINAFFTPNSSFKRDDRTLVECKYLTLLEAFNQLFEDDWKNGCIVGIIDIKSSPLDRRKSNLPRYLLRQKGWEAMDPFLPIRVHPYSDMEFHSVMDYYLDRNWLTSTNARSAIARKEFEYTSCKNPLALTKLTYSK